MPKVSIIVPVYNAEKYLQECAESIPLLRMYTESISVRRKVHCGDRQKATAYGFYTNL